MYDPATLVEEAVHLTSHLAEPDSMFRRWGRGWRPPASESPTEPPGPIADARQAACEALSTTWPSDFSWQPHEVRVQLTTDRAIPRHEAATWAMAAAALSAIDLLHGQLSSAEAVARRAIDLAREAKLGR
jgi:hypothetical protein